MKQSSDDVKQSSDDVKESSHDVEESLDDVKESSDDVKESSDDVKESSDDVEESSDDVKESLHRRFQLKSSSSEPEKVTERLLHHRHEGAAPVLEPLASCSQLQSVVSRVRADGFGEIDDVEGLLDDGFEAKSSRLEVQHYGERSLHVV